jgi:membrane associated rhomboid family serine protease
VKASLGTIMLVVALLVAFGVELASHSAGNEASLLKLGALPDSGELHGQYWRLGTFSFLHFNSTHLLVNVAMLLWIGHIVESRVNFAGATAIYVSSVLCSAAMILLVHYLHPKPGATMGASGGAFGLVGATLVISYREPGFIDQASRLRRWLWLVLLIGLAISFLPEISMAGHVGGLIGGTLLACIAKFRKTV